MNGQSLATRAVRGAFWTGGGIAIQMVVMLVFFKVLKLEDMGQFEWALRVAMLAQLVGALGMNEALVQFREAEAAHFDTAFWTCLGVGLGLAGLVSLGAPALAPVLVRWDETMDMAAFVRILRPMALMIPLASVSGVIRARLSRELEFRAIALSETVSVVVSGAVGLGLLALHFGIWSVIGNAVAREAAMTLSLGISAGWMPGLSFRWSALKQLFGFGLNVTGANVVNYVNNNLDKLFFVPVLLGARANGLYSFAYRYTMMPLTRAAMILTRVSFPTFSKVQDDNAALRRAYLRTVSLIALLAWPALAGGFVYAPEFLKWVKGETMLDALRPLEWLILAGMVKAIGTVVGSIFLAKGKANWSFHWTVINLVVFVPGLYWGVRYGLGGVALVIAAAALVFLVVTQVLVNRLIGLPLMHYFGALLRPALIACAVAAVLSACKPLFVVEPLFSLCIGGVIGGGVYLIGVRLLAWPLVMRFWRDFRGRS